MRCQRQILDVYWWVHVSNAEVLQRSGLSAIGDILRHRRLSVFGHVARLDPGVPAHDALCLMVDTYEGRKASWRRPPGRPRNVWLNKVQEDANALYYYLRCGDLRSPGVMDRIDGNSDFFYVMSTTMMVMMMKDDRLVSKIEGKTNFPRHLQAVRNRNC